MPVHREREPAPLEREKTRIHRDSSQSRSMRRDGSEDRRGIITQEKPSKTKKPTVPQEKTAKKPIVPQDRTTKRVTGTTTRAAAESVVKKSVRETPKSKMTKEIPIERRRREEVRESSKDRKIDERKTRDVKKPEREKMKEEKKKPRETRPEQEREKTRAGKEREKSRPEMEREKSRPVKEREKTRLLLKRETQDVKRTKSEAPKQKKSVITMQDVLDKRMEEKHRMKRVQEDERERKERRVRDRTRTRTLSPEEVKVVRERGAGDWDRMGEEARALEDQPGSNQSEEEEEDYEDDFEDYESDFEEDSETEQEDDHRKPEGRSATRQATPEWEDTIQSQVQKHKAEPEVDIVEQREHRVEVVKEKRGTGREEARRRREMEEVKDAMKRENSGMDTRNPVVKQTEEDRTRRVEHGPRIINFASAMKRQRDQKEAARVKRRGEELLHMITLDTITYTLMDIPAVPYELFIKAYGNSNSCQIHVQTREDDLDEDTQTEVVEVESKWTQMPVEFKLLGGGLRTREERLGVGGNTAVEEDSSMATHDIGDSNKLNEFLTTAGQMVLSALELRHSKLTVTQGQTQSLSFSAGFISLSVSQLDSLHDKPVSKLCCQLNTLLSVHETQNDPAHKAYLCLWSIRQPSHPLKVLVNVNSVTSCCFGPAPGYLVFAGVSDGSVCLWDLREAAALHSTLHGTQHTTIQPTLRSPTYSTAQVQDAHLSPVMSIVCVPSIEDSVSLAPSQVCSMDSEGGVAVWTVVQCRGRRTIDNEDQGLAHWGRVRLVQAATYNMTSLLKGDHLGLHPRYHTLLACVSAHGALTLSAPGSHGQVPRFTAHGVSARPRCWTPGPAARGMASGVRCLAACPFDETYVLAGCQDGSVRLHSTQQDTPLICLNGTVLENGPEAAVTCLCWLSSRPCVFLALDSLSRIHIWDLAVSDMFPDSTLDLSSKKVTWMCMMSQPSRQADCLVLSTACGDVEVHKLSKQYASGSPEERSKELKMFLRYTSIL